MKGVLGRIIAIVGSIACAHVVSASAMPEATANYRAVDVQHPLHARFDALASHDIDAAIKHRRHIHQQPELSNREFNTSAYVASQLRALGLEIRTPIGKTGVVALLRGARPGPTVALRAELDALPYTEEVDLPFKSTVRSKDGKGNMVGVMHACGHDAHMAMLLSVAAILSQMKNDLPGSVMFIFQPGEEGPPPGEKDGALQLIDAGVLGGSPSPEVIFGVHVLTQFETGQIGYRPGIFLAGTDEIDFTVHGRQAHADTPWEGVDAIVVGSQIVLGLQTITSRQIDLTEAPFVLSVMEIHGGHYAAVADSVTMTMLADWYGHDQRQNVIDRVTRTATNIALASGATADVQVVPEDYIASLWNDPKLVARMLPALKRIGGNQLVEIGPLPFNDDFAFYAEKIPGLDVVVGARGPGQEFIPNHSPKFQIDESSILVGVRTLGYLTLDYLLGAEGAASIVGR
jgi:amidohydrolase